MQFVQICCDDSRAGGFGRVDLDFHKFRDSAQARSGPEPGPGPARARPMPGPGPALARARPGPGLGPARAQAQARLGPARVRPEPVPEIQTKDIQNGFVCPSRRASMKDFAFV